MLLERSGWHGVFRGCGFGVSCVVSFWIKIKKDYGNFRKEV
jgi:hypothetical protein